MSQPQILTVGSFSDDRGTLAKIAHDNGLKVLAAENIEQAIAVLCDNRVDMVFADTGVELPAFFSALNESKIVIPVAVVGPAQPVQNAVKAIRLGAIEYLSTPLEKALVEGLLAKLKPDTGDGPIAGDPKSIELLKQAKQFATSDATVLLRGESGTGKEVYSNYVHMCSPRKDKTFVSVNCAAIPENLLESELFGHEKGAFSGALNKRIGKFQQADKGTLLLDEISEMDMALQAKLLRAIQERVIDPVGSSQPVSIDIRLIATTNRNLEDHVAEGGFREDLYFRLNVVALEIPPLRERPGDIEPLSKFYAAMYGEQNGLKEIDISPDALDKLLNCYWKGNVRELENTVHRAVLMMGGQPIMKPEHIVISPMSLAMMEEGAKSTLVAEEKPDGMAAASRYQSASSMFEEGGTGAKENTGMVGRTVHDVERELILSTLDYCKGNRTHAADILGISIRTLRNKLKEYQEGGSALPNEGKAKEGAGAAT